MPDDAIQVELGGDDHPVQSPGPAAGKAVWLVVGIGLGFALSLLFSSSTGREPVAGSGTTTTAAPALGVGAAIPGFPDGLNILVSPGEGRALEVLTWPLEGEPFYRSVPLGDIDLQGTAHFDASGQFLAATTATPDGFVLRTGRPNTFGVVASRVTGFAWHDSDAADLALSTFDEDELQIWVSEDLGTGELAVTAVGIGDVLSAFGDWGFAVRERVGVAGEPPFRTHLLGPTGDLIGVMDGWVVASHQSGLLLVENMGAISVVTADTPGDAIEIRASDLAGDDVVGGEFSPSGNRFAVTSFDGVSVVDLETMTVTNHSIRAGSDSMAWTSDERFLLVSAFRGVAVLDTATGEISSILDSETTRSVAVTPLGGP